MKLELEILTDILPEQGAKKKTPIVRNAKIKRIFNLDEVDLEEYIDTKTGKAISKYCGIYYKDTYYKINKPYELLRDLSLNRTTPILGFAGKSKKFKHGQKKER